MEIWLLNNILAFVIAFLLTGVMIPQILAIAFRRNLFDGHDERKVHKGAVPRLGGLAFVPAIVISVLFVIGINLKYGGLEEVVDIGMRIMPVMFLVCSLLMLYMIGIADDLMGVRYGVKFIVQIFAALLIIIAGVWLKDLCGVLWIGELPMWIGVCMTIVGVVYIVNALNLIDGIDGLASGLSEVALFFYGSSLYLIGQYVYSMMAWAAFGTLLPFLYFNIYGKASSRSKIFMGDTGSLTIGMMIAFMVLAVASENWEYSDTISLNPIVMALSPILIPLFDVARVILRRLRHSKNPFLPDKSHIHHKLLALGLTTRKSLAVILICDAIFLVGNVLLSIVLNVNWVLLIDVIIWTVANCLLTHFIRKRERKLGVRLYE